MAFWWGIWQLFRGRWVLTDNPKTEAPRRRLFGHDHEKRSVRTWVIPLLVIVAIIVFLPRLVALLEK